MAEEGGEGGGGGGGEGQTKAQKIAYDVGVGIRLVNQTVKTAGNIIGVMERVKKLFSSTETAANVASKGTGGAISSITSRITGIGQAAGGAGGSAGIMGLASGIGTIGMAAGYVASSISGISDQIVGLHQNAEDMNNTMAGTFTALGFAENIEGGVAMAETALNRINAAAARLPGETSEYITVFQSGISSLASGFNNNLDQMLAFSNQFAAIGRSLGIDASQIGRDMNLMTREGTAGAGADVATFQRMLPFINSYRRGLNQATVSAQQFNAMTQQQRLTLLQGSFASLQPMIDRAANSYSAISGEFEGHISGIKRAITAPLFDALKDSMRVMNGILSRYEDQIKSAGAGLTSFITLMAAKLSERLSSVFRNGSPLMTAFANFQTRFAFLRDELAHGSGASTNQTGALGVAASVVGGPIVGILTMGFAQFLTHTEEVGQVMEGLVGVLDGLMMVFYQVTSIFGTLGEGVGNGLAMVLPYLVDVVSQVVQGLAVYLAYVSTLVNQISEELSPAFNTVLSGVQSLFSGISQILLPAFEMLGIVLTYMWQSVREHVVPAFNWLAEGIRTVMTAIGDLLARLGQSLREANAANRAGLNPDDPISRALERLSHITQQGQQQAAAENRIRGARTPSARGGNHTHNDFRGSNFDITQKFAEGFDPDRIAAGFITDLETAASNRLQGGFEPLFSIR
jgi:hypothetical protein